MASRPHLENYTGTKWERKRITTVESKWNYFCSRQCSERSIAESRRYNIFAHEALTKPRDWTELDLISDALKTKYPRGTG